MERREPYIDSLIYRILSGSFTPEQFDCFMEWYHRSEENANYFRRIKRVWNTSNGVPSKAENIEMSLDSLKKNSKPHFRKRRTGRIFSVIFSGAALIAVAATLSFIVCRPAHGGSQKILSYTEEDSVGTPVLTPLQIVDTLQARNHISRNLSEITITLSDGSVFTVGDSPPMSEKCPFISIDASSVVYAIGDAVGDHISYNTISVGRGKKFKAVLSDGTAVTINSGSEVRFAERFPDGRRDIFIEGECFVEVAKDAGRPFYAHAGGMSVEAIGTAFNITNYSGEVCSMTLSSGRVRVDAAGESIVADAGTRIEFDVASGTLVTDRNVEASVYTGWSSGHYTINKTTLESTLAKIELLYDTHIVNTSSLDRKMLFTGDFDRMSAEEVIRSLCLNTGISYFYDKTMNVFIIQ